VQVRRAAHPADVAAAGELGGDGDGVGGLALAVEVHDHVVDQLVRRPVEVTGVQHLDDVGDGILADQHGAQHRGLGLQVLRGLPLELRTAYRGDLVTDRHWWSDPLPLCAPAPLCTRTSVHLHPSHGDGRDIPRTTPGVRHPCC